MIFDTTPEGWKAFREAIANIPNLKDGDMWPIIGNFQYHYRPPSNTKILNVSINAEKIHFELHDGRKIIVPLDWFPILKDANEQEQSTFESKQQGEEIRFPLLNTEIHLTQVLRYKGESEQAEFASAMSWPSPAGQVRPSRQKIVIDHSYTDFDLSDEAWAAYGKERPKDLNSVTFRTDPDLIRVVEQLGERANGKSRFGVENKLEIIEVPKGIPIRIESYDWNE